MVPEAIKINLGFWAIKLLEIEGDLPWRWFYLLSLTL